MQLLFFFGLLHLSVPVLDDNSFKADCEDIHTKTLILNDRDSLRVSAGPARTAAAILEAPPPSSIEPVS